MATKQRVVEREGRQGMHDGRGQVLGYEFFTGETKGLMRFADLVIEPGAYVGYHRHEGNLEILYVLSGRAEHVLDGDRCTLEPGDAVLIQSGHAHAIRNTGDEGFRYLLVFAAIPTGEWGSVENLPLPEGVSDWA